MLDGAPAVCAHRIILSHKRRDTTLLLHQRLPAFSIPLSRIPHSGAGPSPYGYIIIMRFRRSGRIDASGVPNRNSQRPRQNNQTVGRGIERTIPV